MERAGTVRLDDGLAEFRAARGQTLALMNGLTQEQLDLRPGRDKWSAGEVLDHVLLAESINREQISTLIEMGRAGRRTPELNLTFADLNVSVAFIPRACIAALGLPLTIMNAFVPNGVRNFLTRNRLVPFQNPDRANPRRGRPGAELRDDLLSSLRETEDLFERNRDLDFSRMTIRHPLLGSYDVPGLLRFMAAHEQRHQSQIDDVLSEQRHHRWN